MGQVMRDGFAAGRSLARRAAPAADANAEADAHAEGAATESMVGAGTARAPEGA
jgi:hypothetical protein